MAAHAEIIDVPSTGGYEKGDFRGDVGLEVSVAVTKAMKCALRRNCTVSFLPALSAGTLAKYLLRSQTPIWGSDSLSCLPDSHLGGSSLVNSETTLSPILWDQRWALGGHGIFPLPFTNFLSLWLPWGTLESYEQPAGLLAAHLGEAARFRPPLGNTIGMGRRSATEPPAL